MDQMGQLIEYFGYEPRSLTEFGRGLGEFQLGAKGSDHWRYLSNKKIVKEGLGYETLRRFLSIELPRLNRVK
jgi:hypothetical protein